MDSIFDALRNKEYPGRIIILGQNPSGNSVAVYAITGRSSSSLARKIEQEENILWVRADDEKIVQKGNKDLLCYPAIFMRQGIAVSNGKQTSDIQRYMGRAKSAIGVLTSALQRWEYESDEPTCTPRISGCILPSNEAALSIIKKAKNGSSIRCFFEVPMIKGKGKLISTYEGPNTDPLPSFKGEPMDVDIQGKTAKGIAEAVYNALRPQKSGKDFRVAVACVVSPDLESDIHKLILINRREREGRKHERDR